MAGHSKRRLRLYGQCQNKDKKGVQCGTAAWDASGNCRKHYVHPKTLEERAKVLWGAPGIALQVGSFDKLVQIMRAQEGESMAAKKAVTTENVSGTR
jgi:hypothetical protein